jgi:hypothetical protein
VHTKPLRACSEDIPWAIKGRPLGYKQSKCAFLDTKRTILKPISSLADHFNKRVKIKK